MIDARYRTDPARRAYAGHSYGGLFGAYVLTTRRDMSFLGGMMMAGFVVLLVAVIANLFLQLPALHMAISALFILFSAGAILWETSNIIQGGETNYIRATVSLYVSLYNIFVSLLSLLGFARND